MDTSTAFFIGLSSAALLAHRDAVLFVSCASITCRVAYLPRRLTGAGFHVATEMQLVRRSGPDSSFDTRTVTILTQSALHVNVVLHKHVCYLNTFAEVDVSHLETVACV
jgi:hypothetical protein